MSCLTAAHAGSVASTSPLDLSLQELLETQVSSVFSAEGVETQAQAEQLLKMGCQEFQGFYFNKPMLVSNISELLSRD